VRGVPNVPTLWRDRLRADELPELFEAVGAEEVVIKPVIGANASGAFRLDRHSARSRAEEVAGYYADRPLMAQPFLRAIPTEGEFSLFYFNGEHSHTILKTPKLGDFRVQEEHGGRLRTVQAEPELTAAGALILAALDEQPLYARADFVRANSGGSYWLMELELIEPSLYFRMDPAAPARFARALHERATRSSVPGSGSR
jgi:glutathione synthase/RimK-type ligase-like ATP-grasp enzyme